MNCPTPNGMPEPSRPVRETGKLYKQSWWETAAWMLVGAIVSSCLVALFYL